MTKMLLLFAEINVSIFLIIKISTGKLKIGVLLSKKNLSLIGLSSLITKIIVQLKLHKKLSPSMKVHLILYYILSYQFQIKIKIKTSIYYSPSALYFCIFINIYK